MKFSNCQGFLEFSITLFDNLEESFVKLQNFYHLFQKGTNLTFAEKK